MDMDQDDSYLKQSLLLGEPLSYIDTQNPYYDALQDLADQESVAHSARIPFHTYQTAAPCLDLGLPPNLFRGNGLRGSWRYNQTLGGGEQNFVPEFQPSPAQCLNQRIVYPTQAVFEESYKMTASSDAEAHKEDVASSSASPKIDSTSATEAWPLASEEPISGFHQDDDVLARDSPGDEETSGDKPYARLIHEALMQAPGHRMMLREIYDWFVQNTTKPSESGTNGWQNSIRHNLSMNQVSSATKLGREGGQSELTYHAGF